MRRFVQKHVVGLDLGQQQDYSALAYLRYVKATAAYLGYLRSGPPPERPLPSKPSYDLPTLKRWPLGTSYTTIGRDVARFLGQPAFAGGDAELVIDETGVGLAVVELVEQALAAAGVKAELTRVTITGGSAVTKVGGGRWHVAKRQLVSALSAVVHGGRLKVAKDQPEAEALIREMATFKAKINVSTGNESFEAWRERDHDDLVLATALPVWAAERAKPVCTAF